MLSMGNPAPLLADDNCWLLLALGRKERQEWSSGVFPFSFVIFIVMSVSDCGVLERRSQWSLILSFRNKVDFSGSFYYFFFLIWAQYGVKALTAISVSSWGLVGFNHDSTWLINFTYENMSISWKRGMYIRTDAKLSWRAGGRTRKSVLLCWALSPEFPPWDQSGYKVSSSFPRE